MKNCYLSVLYIASILEELSEYLFDYNADYIKTLEVKFIENWEYKILDIHNSSYIEFWELDMVLLWHKIEKNTYHYNKDWIMIYINKNWVQNNIVHKKLDEILASYKIN